MNNFSILRLIYICLFVYFMFFDFYVDNVVDKSQHVDKTNKDVFLQLMHSKGPSHYFYRPENENVCWVPFQHILCAVTQPTLGNFLGQYQLCVQSTKRINNALLSHSKKKFVNV